MKKIVSILATFAILTNSLLTPIAVLAQETTPEPTPIETPIEVSTPSPEPTVQPTQIPEETNSPTPEATVEATLEPTATPVETSTPSAEPVSTQTPVQTSDPSSEPTTSPTEKPVEIQKGDIITTVVENVNLNNIILLNSNVDVPNVVTDKPDYSPTSIVFVTGTNFSKNKTYTIEISSTDEPPVANSDSVTTDENGEFTYSYQLDGNYRPNYKIEVKNGNILVTSTTFTDSETSNGNVPFSDTFGSSSVNDVTNWYDSDGNSNNTKIESSGGQSGGYVNIDDGDRICRTINSTGYNSLQLQYYWKGDNDAGSSDNGYVQYKTSGSCSDSSGWTTIFTDDLDTNTGSWVSRSGSLSSTLNNTTFKIRFYNASNSNDEDYRIDTVSISGTLIAPVDTTPPVITINNPTSSPAQSKTITASTNEGTLTMSNTTGSICNSSLTFVAYSSQTFNLESDNGKKVCYKAVDSATNTSYLMSNAISGIDKTAPVITIGSYITAWTNQNVIVGAITNEGSLNENSHTFTSNGTFNFIATDLAGNSSAQGVIISNIDKTLPTIAANISNGVLGLNNWYKSDVTVHFTCSDSDSGVASCPNDQILSSEGSTIQSTQVSALDNAGNSSAQSNVVTVKIDKTIPTATVNYNFTTPTSTDVVASITPSEFVTVTNNGGLLNYTFTNNGSFTFEFIDEAGNMGSATAVVSNIDRVAPIITIDPYITSWTNQDITVNTSVNEGSLNESSHTFTDNGSFEFTATDLAGNASSQTVTITNIDKTPPVLVDQSIFGSFWYNGWMESIFNYWDENDIASGNDPSCMMTTEGANQTCSLTPNVIDFAGNANTTPVTSNTANIDMSAPTGNWIYPVANSTVSGIVTLDFSATDAGSGVLDVEYSYQRNDGLDSFHVLSSNIWDTSGLDLDNYTLRAFVTDNVGFTTISDIVVGLSAVISNENFVTLGTDSVGVSWTTNKPTTSRVVYDTVSHGSIDMNHPNFGYTYSTDTYNGDKVVNHYVTITGLSSGSNFFYRTVSTGSPTAVSGENYFRTFSATGAPASNAVSTSTQSTNVLGINTNTSDSVTVPSLDPENGEEEVLGAETSKEEVKSANTEIIKNVSPVKWILISLGLLILIVIIYKLFKKNK